MKMQLEQREVSLFLPDDGCELRYVEASGEQPHRFVGTIPYDSLSHDLGGFKEIIKPSAFRSTLTSGLDIRALANHNAAQLLGRTSNGTLRVAHTERGLGVEIDMPNTSYANDLKTLVKRRDIRGLSFGFKVRQGGQKFTKEGGNTIRELHDVDLGEVSVVSNPAYGATSLALRSAEVDEEVRAMLNPTPETFSRLLNAKFALLRNYY